MDTISPNTTKDVIRKWGYSRHQTTHINTIPHHRFKVLFFLTDATPKSIAFCEPWCDVMYTDNENATTQYIKKEQPSTLLDLTKKMRLIPTGCECHKEDQNETCEPEEIPYDIYLSISTRWRTSTSLTMITHLSEHLHKLYETNPCASGTYWLTENALLAPDTRFLTLKKWIAALLLKPFLLVDIYELTPLHFTSIPNWLTEYYKIISNQNS